MTGRASKKDAWNSASRQTTGTAAAGTSCRHVYVDEPGSVEQAAKLAADERAGPRSQRGEDDLAAFQPGVRGGDQGAAPVGVGYTDHGAGASDPAGLDERDQRLGEVLQHGAHEDGIDAAVRKRQLVDVAPHQTQRRGTGVEVDTDHHPVRPHGSAESDGH